MLLINYLFVVVRARHRLRVIMLFARSRVDLRVSRAVMCIVSHAAVLFRACRRVSFVSVARTVRTRRRALFACATRRLRVIINCFSLINTHVNNVNSSGHIF
jgi:hypothetical protein